MKTYHIYIETDSNRTCLEITYNWLNNDNINNHNTNRRKVYIEHFDNFILAEKRLIQISKFARVQLEKLVRSRNPNWLSLASENTKNRFCDTMHKNGLYTTELQPF